MTQEQIRLEESRERKVHWKRWGPYLSERAWGTVREDYSQDGKAWDHLPHDQARSTAYRWNEDGIAGFCDRHQKICFAIALWNGNDPILKERLFGLTGNEGNHGEDCKECYYYLDSTPTHSYMKYLYKYPQATFPYDKLVAENRKRSKDEREYELIDTGVFNDNRYFDVAVEFAKADAEDILIRITVNNRGPDAAAIHLLPHIWFRNTWAWSKTAPKPSLRMTSDSQPALELDGTEYGPRWLYAEGSPQFLFTENETNVSLLYGTKNASPFVKDGINDYVVNGAGCSINPAGSGTKAAAHYIFNVPARESIVVRLRFSPNRFLAWDEDFNSIFETRLREADDFYSTVIPSALSPDAKAVMRQCLGGLLWSKQFYHYIVSDWLSGDPPFPSPPEQRKRGRNSDWKHLFNADVISMPDKWEYPWYAAWDLAFHCVPLALVDSEFAKEQLTLIIREWYMHPNGQLPAYEWALGDVNPPVHAWAAWRVYKIEKKQRGVGDRSFLQHVFHKLLLNFTWWVNRKDTEGRNVFEGGFLGLDNIGVFDRSSPLPNGGRIEQADGTGWMAMYCLNLLAIAMELAKDDPAYEHVASKFWEHFLFIADAINHLGNHGSGMWDPEDGFFYDLLHLPDGTQMPLKVRSIVGLIPLYAVETLDSQLVDRLPGFKRRLEWFIGNRKDLTGNVACMKSPGAGERRLLSIVDGDQLRRVLHVMLDEKEFLAPHGIRALSRFHHHNPYTLKVGGGDYSVGYEPAESRTGMFGGNSNWRGPIWFPVNYLIIESLQKFHHYFGDEYKVECPTGSGVFLNLKQVAAELSHRLTHIFLQDSEGKRPVHGEDALYQRDEHWSDLVLFYEYFHGDDGSGLGASHQTGWTGLVAKLLQQSGDV